MKKSLLFALAALTLAACAKQAAPAPQAALPGTHTVTITAGFDESTKTAYDSEGKFSWKAGDVIGVVCVDAEGNVIPVPFTTSESGPVADFTGELPDGYDLMYMATYPFNTPVDGYANNNFAWDEKNFRLWGSIKPDMQDPLSCVPLGGIMEDDGFFTFSTATGIVKFTVVNMPKDTYYTYLETPADSQAYLNGWFTLGPDCSVMMKNATDGYHERYNWNVPTDVNQTMDIYFFLPVGTLPAGTKFEICDENWAAMHSFVFQKDVEVVRNAITEIAPIELEPVTVYGLEDLLGEYEMTDYSSGPYSGNATPGDIVLEASDDESLGNVIMTTFAGVPGKVYGTFDGVNLVFAKGQIFGANPYEDAAEKPYVALDFYKGEVVDPTFEIVSKGIIRAVGADAIGLRSCTQEDWQEFGGGWPWALCFGNLTAQWKGTVEPAVYTKGEEIPLKMNMIYACNSINWDGSGVGGLLDGDPATYWHSDYYYEITNNDPVYGLYFDFTLEADIDAFRFEYQVRQGNAGAKPTRIVYGVSADGESWAVVGEAATAEMSDAAAGDWVQLPAVSLDGPYRHIRLGITDSASTDEGTLTGDLNWAGYKKCVNMAELKLFWAE